VVRGQTPSVVCVCLCTESVSWAVLSAVESQRILEDMLFDFHMARANPNHYTPA
jgi:hypothetical protein